MNDQPWIEPIEKPRNPLTRIAYWMIKRQFGKVIMPAKVIYARYPSLLLWIQKMAKIEAGEVPIDPATKLLVKYYVAWLNGCAFCLDIGEKIARQQKIEVEKFYKVADFETDPAFTERERAALVYARAANNRHVEKAQFDEVRKHFDDKQIIGIAYIVAAENVYNIMNHSTGIQSDQLCAIR